MLHFREFEAGPDPSGRTFHVLFRYQQNGISIRHADTVEVGFLLEDPEGERTLKTVCLPHPDLPRVADDAWCARLAALHLLEAVSTGRDMDKDFLTVSAADLERHAAALAAFRRQATKPPIPVVSDGR